MLLNGTWIKWLGQAALSGGDVADAKETPRFIMLRRVVGYGVIFPLLVFASVITVVLLGFTVLAAKLLFDSIGFLERASMGSLSGKTRI